MKKSHICKIENIKISRLSLRPYHPSDFNIIYNILNNKKVVKYLFSGAIFSKNETELFIHKNFCGLKKYGNLMVTNQENDVIGFCGILRCKLFLERDYEFGFVLDKRFWGNGYATELGMFLIHYAQYNMKIPRVVATVHPNNEASIHVMNKLDMKLLLKRKIKNRGKRCIYIKDFRGEQYEDC